ncbi:hypothetical protein KKG41_02090 [Patescibacteria group bacterium]|nr:hypothetical protein [Patescibacteria group bacterium]MBU1889898.1 hypothetical protein [Patescibacteria group bacterium]
MAITSVEWIGLVPEETAILDNTGLRWIVVNRQSLVGLHGYSLKPDSGVPGVFYWGEGDRIVDESLDPADQFNHGETKIVAL